MTNAEAWFNIALRPRKPEGSLGRTAQDGHLDSHTAPELCFLMHLTPKNIMLAISVQIADVHSVRVGFVWLLPLLKIFLSSCMFLSEPEHF